MSHTAPKEGGKREREREPLNILGTPKLCPNPEVMHNYAFCVRLRHKYMNMLHRQQERENQNITEKQTSIDRFGFSLDCWAVLVELLY